MLIRWDIAQVSNNDTPSAATCQNVLTPGVPSPAYFMEVAAPAGAGPPDPMLMKETDAATRARARGSRHAACP